jgi:hypothetical protein
MPTIEEQQVTAQVLQRISLLPPASPAGPNTQQALRLTAQTAGSGATSPYQPCQPTLEEQGSSHPAPSVLLSPRASQQGAVPQSQQPSRRPSAAQVRVCVCVCVCVRVCVCVCVCVYVCVPTSSRSACGLLFAGDLLAPHDTARCRQSA